jgi:PhoPQ-activated pathogenicity-related protein
MNRTRMGMVMFMGVFLVVGGGPTGADLLDYVAQPTPEFRWEKRGEESNMAGTFYDLHLVSQVWQGIPWEHRLQVFRPQQLEFPHIAVLLNTGGGGSEEEKTLGQMLANLCGATVAILYHIPNQPLFEGKSEDALIAYTFVKFLETGDESWPLLFPMVKSVVRAMDALQEFSKQEWPEPLQEFVITGASKRGWTTWLTAVADARVVAIMPLVYDNLNLAAQMAHQLETWGRFSEQIDDYTQLGLQQRLSTERGRRLATIVDPYTYRQRLTLPKLIVNGTNDRYWALDALNLYWDDLPGEKRVLYVPNAGHDLQAGLMQVVSTCVGFFRQVAAREPLPRLTWTHTDQDGKALLTLTSEPAPRAVHLWVARAESRDFRSARWESTDLEATGPTFVGSIEVPPQGFAALFGEAVYELHGRTFSFSTSLRIVGRE